MGRPKKRRNADKAPETSPTAPSAPIHVPDDTSEEAAMTVPDAAMDMDPALLTDPSLSVAADMSFLDLLGPNFVSTLPFQGRPPNPKESLLDRDIWNFDIDFDPDYPPPPQDGTNTASNQFPPSPSLRTPSLSPSEATPPKTQHPPGHVHDPAPLTPDSCSCLANLYLALDSLARLPAEVSPAIRAARCACKAAHDAVQCQVCSPPLTWAASVPLSALQNTMILCALFPSIADAYQRILNLVDAECARATLERRPLRFTLSGYGGVWGELGSSTCGVTTHYRDVTMEPATWRLMVRTMLKTDVYGINFDADADDLRIIHNNSLQASHLGLKDIIAQMDERSRARHAEIDALIEAGLPPPTGPNGMSMPPTQGQDGEEPTCRRVIKIAKEAVDRLLIA